MRQTSTDFMDKMLEDNEPTKIVDHAAEIDKRIDAALSKLAENLEKVGQPAPQDDTKNIINEKEKKDNDAEGNAEGSRDTGAEDSEAGAPEDDN